MTSINKIGIKIYEGSTTNLINVKKTMDNSFDFENIPLVNDTLLSDKLKDLKKLNQPIYVWAGVARVRIEVGDKIVFVNLNRDNPNNKSIVAYIFTLVDKAYDRNSEIHKYVGWKGQNWENVVFLKDKKIVTLDNQDFNEIKKLTGAYYNSSRGFAGWKQQKYTLYRSEKEEFLKIIQIF